jgi:hypothetical protein
MSYEHHSDIILRRHRVGGRALRQLLVTSFPVLRAGFNLKSGHVEFMMGKVASWRVFSQYFGFSCHL